MEESTSIITKQGITYVGVQNIEDSRTFEVNGSEASFQA